MSTAATRKLILDTALNLFNEAGPEATSFRRIAREAELAYSNLCYHFPDKKRLAFAVYQRLAAAWEHEPPPEASLSDLRRWTLAMHASLQRYRTFTQRHQEWLHYSAGVKIDFTQRRQAWHHQLTALFGTLTANPGVAPDHLAESWLFYLFQWPAWCVSETESDLWAVLETHLLQPAGIAATDSP